MRFQSPRPRSDEERILPLINVVFLLLIFFMLAGRLAATDPFPVKPPASASDGEAGVRDLVVLVAADGRVAVDGEPVAPEALGDVLTARLARDGATRVQLKGDARAEAVHVVAIMEQLRDAGVERLRLLTVANP